MHLYGIRAMQGPVTIDPDAGPELAAACNCLAIRQAARQVTQYYERHLAAAGLTASQFSILAKLARLGPLSINALAQEMVMDRTTTGRAIQPLLRARLVAVAPGRDARMRLVRLTPSGEKRVRAALDSWRQAQDGFERSYGSPEAATLRAALARAVTAAS